jgi:DNA-binding MarR family transcriptional regulator
MGKVNQRYERNGQDSESSGLLGLIAQCHLQWKRYLQQRLAPLGITLKQYYVLAQLARLGTAYPAELAKMLYSDRPTASVVIRNLERKRWIRRSLDPENARHTLVALTTEGRDKLDAVEEAGAFNGQDRVRPLSIFAAEERKTLRRLLARLHNYLEETTISE